MVSEMSCVLLVVPIPRRGGRGQIGGVEVVFDSKGIEGEVVFQRLSDVEGLESGHTECRVDSSAVSGPPEVIRWYMTPGVIVRRSPSLNQQGDSSASGAFPSSRRKISA